jgi:hypothetical protein
VAGMPCWAESTTARLPTASEAARSTVVGWASNGSTPRSRRLCLDRFAPKRGARLAPSDSDGGRDPPEAPGKSEGGERPIAASAAADGAFAEGWGCASGASGASGAWSSGGRAAGTRADRIAQVSPWSAAQPTSRSKFRSVECADAVAPTRSSLQLNASRFFLFC